MPKLDDVLNLIHAIGSRDYGRARRAAELMAVHERENKREQAARAIEQALKHWPNQQLTELPQSVTNLVWPEKPKRSLDSLYLTPHTKAQIHRFLDERSHAEHIRQAGLPVTNKILLIGPPGNGKTTLAEAMAHELGLAYLSVKLHSLIESYMGATGKNLGKLFEYILFNNALLFLDELDAIGSLRNGKIENTIKEYNVVVNTLLTNIDRMPDTSVLIAATNLPDAVDPALRRRFELKLLLEAPSDLQIYRYFDDYQQIHSVDFGEPLNGLVKKLSGVPWSDIVTFCQNMHKDIILGRDSEEEIGQAEEELDIPF